MAGKKQIVKPRGTVKYSVQDTPAVDVNGKDVYLDGFIIEVLPPGEEEFEVFPAAFIDATIEDDGTLPGQVTAQGVVLRPKRMVALKIEDFVEHRNLPLDGTWVFTHRHVSLSGKVSAQEPYTRLYLDLSEPARCSKSPEVQAFPASGAISFGGPAPVFVK